MNSPRENTIGGVIVAGVDIDDETRCAHYRSERDIIAIKFKCCGKWFPCHRCHGELAGHPAEVWPKEEFNTPAVLCGACGSQLTVSEYLACDSVCPKCSRDFNPGCALHHDLYFNVGGA